MTTFLRLALLAASFAAFVAGGQPELVIPIHVTTLAAKGPGSLRAALEDPRPRLVVFDVAGVIDLGGRTLVVRNPHLVLAGQTAPDPGITLIRGGLVVETHDVRIEHIAVRPGDGDRKLPDWAPDALGVRRADAPVHDVVFDHCSATWSIDENLSTSGPADVDADADPDATAHDVTLRHCLIAEALSNATHPKGEHSKGTLVHDGVRNVTIEGCLYAHNRERNPRVKGGATARVVGNVMYDWGSACVGVGAQGNRKLLKPAEVTLIANVAIAGPATKGKTFVKGVDPGGRVTLAANLLVPATLTLADDRVVTTRTTTTLDPAYVLVRVLRTAGARPARRDPIDARIVRSVIDGTGHLIDSQNEVGGYPVRAETRRVLTVPKDWEAWIAQLSKELGEDKTLDVTPLVKRIAPPREPR